ncbi:major facilitator superfamily domain-containing protein [Zychaea mexicana]|uniref:major facilitator superfamily domain-containing protein n=1 Tax=Zychaea mexicana TaxID=64656 RepID=UPI0022FDC428|nr:major facilitator superfamily domain-containing protein [Zychaea mexicana]KAI9491921.1 major facilitator superfamily domain-containing protein [Zychaea mexicana]
MTALTWIGSLWYWFANCTGPIYLWMTSKVDDRWMVAAACLVSTLAMMLASITNAVWQLYLTQGVLSGIGTSLCWFSCMRAPQQWFNKRRGLAVGITMSASGVGGLVLNNLANGCFRTIGYRWALRIFGFFDLVFLAIAAVTCFRLNPPAKNVPIVDVQDWKNRRFIILFLIHFVGNFAFYVPSGFVPTYAEYMDMDSWIKTNLSAIMSAMMVVGKIGLGFVSDYIGRFNMAVICGIMACIAHLCVWMTATSEGSMWAFAVLYGLFGGGYIAMITAVIAEVVGVDRIDSGTGWAFFAWSWGGFAAQPVASAIIESGGGDNFTGAIM